MQAMIAVCGSDSDDRRLNHDIMKKAEEVGREIARKGAVLLSGGRGGIMEASCKGAKEEGGTTIGILPYSKEEANPYVDFSIATGLGNLRNFVIVNAADAIIAICGRSGTMSEISFAMILEKPVVFLKGSDGVVDKLIEAGIAKEKNCYVATSPREAVEMAFHAIKSHQTP